jgi:putative nucleotidyltransferase with HDIG domain
MRKIIFVDDEPRVLEGLQRMLRPLRHEWDMSFAGSGVEALDAMDAKAFDVVVSDIRMPVMDGAKLLTEVMKRHPNMVRIVLSGQSDQELSIRSVGLAHQYLSKPCEADILRDTVMRACAIRELLADEALQLLLSQMQSIPSIPALYLELIEELRSPNASLKKAGEIISKDIGMTAKILQMVNSAFFGVRRHISNPAEAVNLLGLDLVASLVLSIQVFSQFKQDQSSGFSPDALWAHSVKVAMCAKNIAKAEGLDAKGAEDAFTAGLLHDAGKLLLAANRPKQFKEAMSLVHIANLPTFQAEQQIFGASHGEVGAYLLGLWGLPDSIVESIAYHHEPGKCLAQSFSPLTAVYIANMMEHETGSKENDESLIDRDYLTRLNLMDRLGFWQEICKADSTE